MTETNKVYAGGVSVKLGAKLARGHMIYKAPSPPLT
jgi:hypothetical protein